jgi:hypothetical protein
VRPRFLLAQGPVQQRLILITPRDVSQTHCFRLGDNRYDIRHIAGAKAPAYCQLNAFEQSAFSPFLNPIAYKQLAPLGGTVAILFLLLGAALITAGVGWFRRRLWGRRLGVAIIAGALFLLLPNVRATFA